MFPLTFLTQNQVPFWFTLPKRQSRFCPYIQQGVLVWWQMCGHPGLTFRVLLPMQSMYGFFSLLMKYTCPKYGISKYIKNKCFSLCPVYWQTSQPYSNMHIHTYICVYMHTLPMACSKAWGRQQVSAQPRDCSERLTWDFHAAWSGFRLPGNIVSCCMEDNKDITSVESECWGKRTTTDDKVKLVFIHSLGIWRV